ncbi:hypothetical protein [Streptomyces sp. NPDC090445]|uniref:hypothetical protein n=1 Tax=Streptomyces sp. NPDC090445 TaxID=3365963 RepID=UPI0037F73D04
MTALGLHDRIPATMAAGLSAIEDDPAVTAPGSGGGDPGPFAASRADAGQEGLAAE